MASIRIGSIAAPKPQVTEHDRHPHIARESEYIFKDIELDFQFTQLLGNVPANKSINAEDINDIRDIRAVVQSVRNIMGTVPGQKLLNPYLGLDLSKYIFDPITEQTADLIARAVLKGLGEQEPRVKINHLTVVASILEHAYHVQFTLEFPNINHDEIALNGTLNRGGLKILN